ncbi:MAG: DUF732 domain-containing protein [Egibacteraceae bacterium]
MGRATALLVVVLVAGGCGGGQDEVAGATAGTAVEEERYLNHLRTRDALFQDADAADLIATGRAVCDQLDQGADAATAAGATPDDWTAHQSETLTRAAISNYCRQHLAP